MNVLALMIFWQRWWMKVLAALSSGLLFGAGLIASGMSDQAKVFGFLDLAGVWDPSLALVMAGAIGVAVLPFAWARRREISWLGTPMDFPPHDTVNFRLVFGSLLFGIGWGLCGICPGPALIGLVSGYLPGIIFAIGMLLGMAASEWTPEGSASEIPSAKPVTAGLHGIF